MLTVSDTAYSIAFIRSEEADRPPEQRLFDDPYAKLFAAEGAHAAEGTQRYLALSFFRDGIRLRTRFIDDVLRKGLDDGVDQVVLLGAGFDARGLRMPASHRATVYEVDVPALLERKRAILASADICSMSPATSPLPTSTRRWPRTWRAVASGLPEDACS
jgi:methyltransferase (TIGR00027 family)